MSLNGRVAIITGASRGIGREIALTFARDGARAVVVAAKSTESTPQLPGSIFTVAKEVTELGSEGVPIKCDVRNDKEIEDMVEETVRRFGRIDILINNAGALWWKKMIDTDMKRYDLINQINVRATYACTRACLPHMLRQGFGRVVIMSPPISLHGLDGKVAYFISKFGMTLIAHGLGKELKGTGITVNALWPATMVESFATINHKLGEKSLWRKASIIADSTLGIVTEGNDFTGSALIDEEYLRKYKAMTDFTQYRCDPNVEPPNIAMWSNDLTGDVGLIVDTGQRSAGLPGIAKL